MKNLLCLFLVSTFSMACVQGQIIYGDNFDENILTAESNSAYTNTLSNDNWLITANGTAGQYVAFDYVLHNNGTETSINLATTPKLYIKVKGMPIAELRIDLKDEDGFVTTVNPQTIIFSQDFTIYEIDYSGRFQDAGYGGTSCSSGPCSVDASKIASIVMFVNAATGGYSGNIEVDWISFGEPLEDLPPPSDFDIRYNQVSYLTGREKLINIVAQSSFTGIPYTVYDSSGAVALMGTTGASALWTDANEHTATVDVSSIDTEGEYRFEVDGQEIYFNVSDDGYAALREEAFKYYYYNRASTPVLAAHVGNDYARAAGHPDTEVFVHSSAASPNRPTGTQISAPKGWYDAGDYNKYIVNSGISTYTLLAAYEHYMNYYKGLDFNIPEQGGNIPDILDEAIWNLDWMLAMQDRVENGGDGGVYHKLTGLGFSGNETMPDEYNEVRYVVAKSTSAALNFAAVMAVASRIFEDYESAKPGYSAQMLAAAEEAYEWAKANPTVYFTNPSGVITGQYGDGNVSDEFQWAAVELFITTNKSEYKNDIDVSDIGGGTPGWQYTAPLALISIAHHTTSLAGDINVTAANNTLIGTADQLKNRVNSSPMRVAMSTNDYVWGSNGNAGNQLIILIRAYELTGDSSYLDAAYTAMDYLFGRNGTGYSFVTGFGDQTPFNPHHRISLADGVLLPVPGMIVGGPHIQPVNPIDCSGGYPTNYPASAYLDEYCSYSRNEITINWNAPLVYATQALHYYQSESTLSVDSFEEVSETFKVYPNPASDIVKIKAPENVSNTTVELYTIQGKKVFSKDMKNVEETLNIKDFTSGLYLVKMTSGNQTITKKIVKQ